MGEYGNELKCPYCGHEETDSWEMISEDGDLEDVECGNCEKNYYGRREIVVEYYSESAKDKEDRDKRYRDAIRRSNNPHDKTL